MSNRPSDAASIRSDLKIIVIGSSGAGKTSYVNQWTKNIFQEEYKATIVSEFGFKCLNMRVNFIVYNYGI